VNILYYPNAVEICSDFACEVKSRLFPFLGSVFLSKLGHDITATEVDAACGAILEELRRQDALDNTVIIFTTDNGNFHAEVRR
jgi:membrane-anchored protein YejM (alkaline phosphatase superfamily)